MQAASPAAYMATVQVRWVAASVFGTEGSGSFRPFLGLSFSFSPLMHSTDSHGASVQQISGMLQPRATPCRPSLK